MIAGGFLLTGITFSKAQSPATYRDYKASDGTARYDDVWGG
jgi:hypothetical protein